MIKLFKIKGDSLFPIYKDGQVVLALSYKMASLKKEDIVIFTTKKYKLMIKKIKQIESLDNIKKYYVIGTTASSIDSRNFGFIEDSQIQYKVLFKIF